MSHPSKLPKTIYVKWNDPLEPFLDAFTTLEQCADKDEAEIVGTYVLQEIQEVTMEIKTILKTRKTTRK